MVTLTLYTKPDCCLCERALKVLRVVQSDLAFRIEQKDITESYELERAYFDRIPVVDMDGEELFEYTVDEVTLRERLLEKILERTRN